MATAERERPRQGLSKEGKARAILIAADNTARQALTDEYGLDREDWARINTYDPQDPTFGYQASIRARMIAQEKADAAAQALSDQFSSLTSPVRIHLPVEAILGRKQPASPMEMTPLDGNVDFLGDG
jgi:hypothetical protein